MEYRENRKEWLSTLEVGDSVSVSHNGSYLHEGKVIRQTRTLFICEVQMWGGKEQVRFVRKNGLQFGGGMALHIPDWK